MCFGWGGSGGHGDAQGAALPVKHLEDQLGVCSGWHRHGSRLRNTAYEYHLTFFSKLRGAAVGLSGSIKTNFAQGLVLRQSPLHNVLWNKSFHYLVLCL